MNDYNFPYMTDFTATKIPHYLYEFEVIFDDNTHESGFRLKTKKLNSISILMTPASLHQKRLTGRATSQSASKQSKKHPAMKTFQGAAKTSGVKFASIGGHGRGSTKCAAYLFQLTAQNLLHSFISHLGCCEAL